MTDKPVPASETPETEDAQPGRKPVPAKRSGFAVGAAAVGIGSAAIVAALLYVRHRKRGA